MTKVEFFAKLCLVWDDKPGTKKYIQNVGEIVLPDSIDVVEVEKRYGIKSNGSYSKYVILNENDVEFFKPHLDVEWNFDKYEGSRLGDCILQ